MAASRNTAIFNRYLDLVYHACTLAHAHTLTHTGGGASDGGWGSMGLISQGGGLARKSLGTATSSAFQVNTFLMF
jgi:hypothetical protein